MAVTRDDLLDSKNGNEQQATTHRARLLGADVTDWLQVDLVEHRQESRAGGRPGLDELSAPDHLEREPPARAHAEFKRLVGAAVIASPIAPVLAFILSVLALATWLRDPAQGQTLLTAAVGDLVVAWLVLAIAAWVLGLSTARGALPGTFGELVQWIVECDVWIKLLEPCRDRLPSLNARAAYEQLRCQQHFLRRDLADNGANWFLGTGYVNAWWRVHQAQEALVRLVPEDTLRTLARVELLRLKGSGLPSEAEGTQQLENALVVLGAAEVASRMWVLKALLERLADALDHGDQAAVLLARTDVPRACQQVVAITASAKSLYETASLDALSLAVTRLASSEDVMRGTDGTKVRNASTDLDVAFRAIQTTTVTTPPVDIEDARNVVYTSRMKIDNYRDKARSGLARSRADLTRTLMVTGFLGYALFWVAIEARITDIVTKPPQSDSPVMAFAPVVQTAMGALGLFLWGAVVSLFAQLLTKSTAGPDTGEDDFGIAISRLLAVPVIAGMAGLCGVVVGSYGGPLLSEGLSGLSNLPDNKNLVNAFLPGTAPGSLVYAAVFALSPNLLISRIQSAAGFQKSLSSTSVGDGGSPTAAGGGK